MFNFLKNCYGVAHKFSERTNLGAAYRYPRLIAGQCTSLFFFLGSIAQVPFNKIMNGSTAVMVTSVIGITTFATKAKENYEASDPKVKMISEEITRENQFNSTYKTLMTLNSNPPLAYKFLRELNLNPDNYFTLDEYNTVELQKLCLDLYTALQTSEHILQKYIISAFQTFAEFAGNYLEFMLAKAFWSYAPYDLDEGLSLRNLGFLTVTLSAIYNSLQIYEETKKTYEVPEQEKLSKDILIAFNKFCLRNPGPFDKARSYGSMDDNNLTYQI